MSQDVKLLYLQEEDVIKAGVLDMRKCCEVIEEMFVLMGQGDYMIAGPNRNDHGAMLWFNENEKFDNIPKAGPDRRFMSLISYLGGNFDVVGNKWYGSNIENLKRDLPRSIHTFTLNDKDTGAPLSIMAGNLISSTRTGAVPGVVSNHLAKKGSKVIGAIGGGAINQSCIEAIHLNIDTIEKIILFDINLEKGKTIAKKLERKIKKPVEVVDDINDCISQSDIITVATSGKIKPVIDEDVVKPGSLIILSGAAELSANMYKKSRIVSDLWSMHEKWLEDGLSHPKGIESIRNWVMSADLLDMVNNKEFNRDDIDDLGDIINGNKNGRTSENEIIISLVGGLPTEDLAWGYHVYQNALKNNIGLQLPLWHESHVV